MRPTDADIPDVVVTAVLRDGDRVLLCHRSPERRWYPNVWDLPGGHVEAGESPAAALVRELREELGITITEPSPQPLTVVNTTEYSLSVWVIDADSWEGAVTNTAPAEHDALAWVTAEELSTLPLADPWYLAFLTAVLTEAAVPRKNR